MRSDHSLSTEWVLPLCLTDYPPGSPTEENSPTRYKEFECVFLRHDWPTRDKTQTWEVRAAGSWEKLLKMARPPSSRKRKRRAKRKGNLQVHYFVG